MTTRKEQDDRDPPETRRREIRYVNDSQPVMGANGIVGFASGKRSVTLYTPTTTKVEILAITIEPVKTPVDTEDHPSIEDGDGCIVCGPEWDCECEDGPVSEDYDDE